MIAIMKKTPKLLTKEEAEKLTKPQEIVVTRTSQKLIQNESGRLEYQTFENKVNITRMVNETKKVIKGETAAEKLAEIQNIFSK